MKRQKIKSLSLNKKSISNLENQINGGGIDLNETHLTYTCPKPNTFVKACSNHMCDSRLGGCPSYYCN